jgi:putative ABC transport system permease protein
MIAYEGFSRLFYDDGKSTRLLPRGATVTTNTFEYLGVQPVLGRTFSADDGRPGSPPVFVINYRLWQREFGSDPKILGKIFILRGKPMALVGIMPPKFNAFDASVWIPQSLESGSGHFMGRLKPGVSVQAAGADLDAIAHRFQKANPGGIFPEQFTIVAESLLDSAIGSFKKTLYALLAAVFLLLLIACSNVANLLLSRATVREREMAMRAALGATRGRLIGQLLVESFVLAIASTAAGGLLAYGALHAIIPLIPVGTLPDETVVRMNLPVFFLTLGVTLLTTILCGLAPALHVVRGDVQPRLAGAIKNPGGHFGYRRLRGGLVVAEVALSIVLLIAAGLLMRSFLVLTHVDLGFDPKNVLYFELVWPDSYNFSWSDPASMVQVRIRKNSVTRQLLDRMKTLPGVVSAAECIQEPPLKYDWSDLIIPGRPHTERWEIRHESVSEDYFQTLQLPLLRGRFFSKYDLTEARFVAVVNESFSRQYFPNENPIGHRVKLEILDRTFLDAPHNTYFEIVGIAGDYKTRNFENPSWQKVPEVFIPYSVQGFSWRTFLVRTSVDSRIALKSISNELRAIDSGIAIGTPGTLQASLHEFYRGPQFELVILTTFAGIGLVLVVIGVFSVMAYTVSLQTHEIGIRMALGAQQKDILRLAMINGFRLVAVGVLIGLLTSYGLTRFFVSQISGVSPTDPWTFAAVVMVIVFVGLAACLLPARSAASVDPLVALRYE